MTEEILRYLAFTGSRAANGLLIFSAFCLSAKAVDVVLTKLFKRLARKTKSAIDDRIIEIVHRPLFYGLVIIGAVETINYLNPSEKARYYSESALYSLMVVVAGVAAVRLSNLLTENALARVADITGLGKDVVPFLKNVWKVVIFAAGGMFVLAIWKINVAPVLASAGIAGVAVALAAKDTIANFFGGVSIFVDRPYKVGDYIVLDGGERGEVVEIGIRSTRIKTRDDVLITIPNSIIANTKVINESAPVPKFRVRIPVGVAYGTDIDLVEEILLDVARNNSNVVGDPPPRVRFRGFGDSALNFELLCWAGDPSIRGLTVHELNSAIYKGFYERGIRIPFPQRDVHLQGGASGAP